jgi:hypothetical protein
MCTVVYSRVQQHVQKLESPQENESMPTLFFSTPATYTGAIEMKTGHVDEAVSVVKFLFRPVLQTLCGHKLRGSIENKLT